MSKSWIRYVVLGILWLGVVQATGRTWEAAYLSRLAFPQFDETAHMDLAPNQSLLGTFDGQIVPLESYDRFWDQEGYLVNRDGIRYLGWPTDPQGRVIGENGDILPIPVSTFQLEAASRFHVTTYVELAKNLPLLAIGIQYINSFLIVDPVGKPHEVYIRGHKQQ